MKRTKLTGKAKEVFARFGREGAMKLAKSMTSQERKERARKAAVARWAKKGEKK